MEVMWEDMTTGERFIIKNGERYFVMSDGSFKRESIILEEQEMALQEELYEARKEEEEARRIEEEEEREREEEEARIQAEEAQAEAEAEYLYLRTLAELYVDDFNPEKDDLPWFMY